MSLDGGNDKKRIAAIPGDGVGPEVVDEALRVLDVLDGLLGSRSFEVDFKPWGSSWYRTHREMMPADGIDILRKYDALIFGAVGDPQLPDHITLRNLLLPIRFAFDQYVNLRPARLFPGVPNPLHLKPPFEMIFVREGVEGEYAGVGGRLYSGTDEELATQTSVFTRRGVDRVLRWSFEYARASRRTLTSVSKGNALQYTGVLWDDVFQSVAEAYPDVQSRNLLVDAAALLMVREPETFQVVVGSNLFADILTDLAAGIVGGLGVAPSASLNPDLRFPSTFEPVHGSAPDIAGKGIANPIGMIWSTALMVGHLGLANWEDAIVNAIEVALSDPKLRTPDIGGVARMGEVTDGIIDVLLESRDELATMRPIGPKSSLTAIAALTKA